MPYAPTILVVDDDDSVRRLFMRILEDFGYFAIGARSGREALRAVEESFFDAMIVDLSMPEMDGFEVLRAVRSVVPDIKVLVVSGFMAGGMLTAARMLGATAILEKISAPERLLKTVCNMLDETG